MYRSDKGEWQEFGVREGKGFVIPANMQFCITIKKVTEDTSSTADIPTFISKLPLKTYFMHASTAGDVEKIEAKSEIFYKDGTIRLPNDIFGYGWTYDGGITRWMNGAYRRHRIVTEDIQKKNRKIFITPASGFKIAVAFYSEGVYTSETSFVTTTVEIEENQEFRLTIARVTEDIDETASFDEFTDAVSVSTCLSEIPGDVEKIFDSAEIKVGQAEMAWELGTFSDSTGGEVSSTTRIRCGFVEVSSGTKIQLNNLTDYNNYNLTDCMIVFSYDKYKQFISKSKWCNSFIVPADVWYIRLVVRKATNNPEIDTSEVAWLGSKCEIVRHLGQDVICLRYNNNSIGEALDEVSFLHDGIDAVIDSNTNYRHTDIPVYQTITGWELKGDGASSQASGFILRKYKVTAGDLIYLKIIKDGTGTFQFQSAISVPENVPNPYLVGAAHTSAIDGYVIAPSGATYLIVSQRADNTANVIQNITYDYGMDTNLMFMMGNTSFTNKIFVVNGSTITIQSKPKLYLYYKGKTYEFPGDAAQEYTLTNGKTLVFDTDALISGGTNVSSISQIFYLVNYAEYSDKCIPVCNYRKDYGTDRLFWSPLFAQYYYENLTDDSQIDNRLLETSQIDNRLLETYLIGHGRDYYTAPENTLPLWELQRSRGLNVLEGDVAVTSDGVPVLLHDAIIGRTSDGTGGIAGMTYAQASQYNYNAGHTSYGNVALPTLAEFLSYAHKYNMCVELDMAGHSYTDANIRTIITMVIKKGMLSRTVFTMPASNAYQKVLSVDARCIVMATNVTTTADIDTALSYKAKFVSIPFASLTSALCDYAHSKGMLVKTWTIDTASDCLSAFETGADCVNVDKISYDDVFGVQ